MRRLTGVIFDLRVFDRRSRRGTVWSSDGAAAKTREEAHVANSSLPYGRLKSVRPRLTAKCKF